MGTPLEFFQAGNSKWPDYALPALSGLLNTYYDQARALETNTILLACCVTLAIIWDFYD
jgi:hypothetical protein